MPREYRSHDISHLIDVVQVFPANNLLALLGVGQLAEEQLVGVQFIGNLVLDLQFFVVIPVLVFESVFGVDLDGVLVFFGLHRDYVVIFLLFLVDLLVRDVSVEGLQGVASEVRQARTCFMRESLHLRPRILSSVFVGFSLGAGFAVEQLKFSCRFLQPTGKCMPRVEPTLEDALDKKRHTRWGWSILVAHLHDSGSFVTAAVPQQIYKGIFIIQIELTMHLDSSRAESAQKDLLPMVKQYLSSVLFRNAYHYEAIAHNHAKYLEFNVQKVAPGQDEAEQYQDIFVEHLLLGNNQKSCLSLQMLRVIQYNHVLICLAIDELSPLSKQRNVILAIIFGNKEAAKKWTLEYSFLTTLKIKNPYKSIHKFYTPLQLILTRPENIEVKRQIKMGNRQPEVIKNEGNCKFREKNYEQALLIYEIGLGVSFEPDKKRQRAVFYANSSQCLYQMRLFQSALLYAEISITLDRTYIKGLYRKLNCLLELQTKQIPRVISSIHMMGSQSQAEQAQLKYTKYMANQCGVFDWMDIFQSATPVFGEYISNKLEVKRFNKEEMYLRAVKKINQHELIIVHKPLIYKKSEQEKFGEEYTALTRQIETYAKYEELFYEKFENLPYQHLLHGQPLAFERSISNESMEINEIHTICLRCLELQKTIENVTASKTQILGIWQKLYAFRHECLANCTYIHIKGALVVFALKDIQRDQVLSIDFLNWQTINRKSFMRQKLGKTCKCVFCTFQWQQYQHTSTPQILYQLLTSQKGTLGMHEYDKINLYFMWQLIYDKRYRQSQLMKEYLVILERYPIWECIMNCLRYLRSRTKNDLFDLIKATLKRIFEKYFKINHTTAVKLLKFVL